MYVNALSAAVVLFRCRVRPRISVKRTAAYCAEAPVAVLAVSPSDALVGIACFGSISVAALGESVLTGPLKEQRQYGVHLRGTADFMLGLACGFVESHSTDSAYRLNIHLEWERGLPF